MSFSFCYISIIFYFFAKLHIIFFIQKRLMQKCKKHVLLPQFGIRSIKNTPMTALSFRCKSLMASTQSQ